MRLLIASIFCFLLVSCSNSEKKDFHGFLYFASGNYVGRFDLRDGSSTVVANLGDVTINSIDSMASERLLVSMVSFVGDREIPRIGSLDVKTGGARDLFPGTDAIYLNSAASVVYNDGKRIAEASVWGRSKSYLADTLRINAPSIDLLAVGEEAVLFSLEGHEPARIQYLNLITRESLDLDRLSVACDLEGAVWIASLQRLACKARARAPKGSAYVLVSLDGMRSDPLLLPEGREMAALTYVGNQDLLILVERRKTLFGGRDKWTVWGHDVANAANYQLSADQYLGASAVYMDH